MRPRCNWTATGWRLPPIRLSCSRSFSPGGNIGHLAVNGTVNDLAMSGAQPLFLSAGFILEEGLPLEQGVIVTSMAAAAREAGVTLVAGDTKVVDRGHGDGVYINTSGVGLLAADIQIGPQCAQPGDAVIVSGEIGLHGVAVLSVRAGVGIWRAGGERLRRPQRVGDRPPPHGGRASRPPCAARSDARGRGLHAERNRPGCRRRHCLPGEKVARAACRRRCL